MDAELDTLATALYVKTDELLKERPEWALDRPAVGITRKFSDAELVTLAVLQWLHFQSRARASSGCLGGHFAHVAGFAMSRWAAPARSYPAVVPGVAAPARPVPEGIGSRLSDPFVWFDPSAASHGGCQ